jgi:hypothetical protein
MSAPDLALADVPLAVGLIADAFDSANVLRKELEATLEKHEQALERFEVYWLARLFIIDETWMWFTCRK